MDKRKFIQIWKYVGLFIGCFSKFTSGSIFVFNAYQNAIKSMFNYTQSEVELLSSSLNLGLGTGFLPGMIFDHLGPFWTSGLGLIVSGGAYFLIWSTTKSVEFYKIRSGLMAFYFYLAGFGSLFSYMAALNTNVINFPEKHRGKVIGLLNAFFTGSPSVFALLYYHVFSTGDYNVIKNQDYSGFMLFFAILFITMNVLCMFLLHDLSKWIKPQTSSVIDSVSNEDNSIQQQNPESSREPEQNGYIASDQAPILPPTDEGDRGKTHLARLVTVLKNCNFHLLLVSFTFAAILSLVNTNNITVITKSVGLSSYDNILLICMPIANTVLSLLIGPISDKVQHKMPRLTFFLISCVLFTVAELIFLFFANSITGLTFGVIIIGTAIGTLWTIVPTIVSEMFGTQDFGRNWGILLMCSGLGSLAGQAIFGRLYDDNITDPGSLNCYGTKCFTSDFIFMTVLGVISIALAAILEIRHKREYVVIKY